MKSSTKKSLYKIFVSLFVVFYTFLPQSIVIGQVIDEVSQENTAPTEEVIIPEESLPQEEVVLEEEELPPVVEEPLVEEVPIEEPVVSKPVIEPEEVIKEISPIPLWVINGDSATTYDVVQLGKTYIAPQNSRVRIIFTKLPERPTKLTIREITLTQEEIDATGAISDKAYDITTDMIDGTFEYDLTLPLVGDSAKIGYAENEWDLISGINEIDSYVSGDVVKSDNINHFTVFLTYADESFSIVKTNYIQGDTVYMKATDLSNGAFYRIDVIDPNGNSTNVVSCQKNVSSLEGSYSLSSSATTGNWSAVLTKYTGTWSEWFCDNKWNASETINVNFTVSTNVVPNPPLTQSCGLDIALVIDISSSINSTELSQMKSAMISFVDSLEGTPTQFSVTKFGTDATIVQSFTSDFNAVKTAINNIGVGINQGTNWEDGISTAKSTFDPRTTKPNLIIFASDGNPTYPNCGGGSTCQADVDAAVAVANVTKSAGIRILALGIGDGLNVDNLKAISGNIVNGSDLLTTDVITTDFSTMAGQLADFASQTCGGTISVNKYLEDENTTGGAGWVFTLSGTSGATLTTDSNGQANSGKIPTGTYSIAETLVSGYSFLSAECTNQDGAIVGTSATNGLSGITIDDSDIITCDFINKLKTGTIIVDKVTDPSGDSQSFSFTTSGTGYSGFSLTDSSTPNSQTLVPGTYSVSEDSVSGWTNTSAVCVSSIEDTETIGNLELDNGETITCTFTNSKLSIDVVKTANPTSVPETGGDVEFTIRVNNSSAVSVNLTSLVDDKFGDLDGVGTCDVPKTIVSDDSYECKFTKTLSGEAGESHINTVTAVASGVSDTDDATVDFSNVLPTIEVTKTPSVSVVPETGGNVTFTFTVKNTSSEESVTIKSLSDSVYGTLSGDADCKVGTVLASGATCDFSITKWVEGDYTGSDHVNVFTGKAVDNDGTEAVDTDDATVDFSNVLPTIEVTKTANPTAIPETGGNVTFTFTVKNTSSEESVTIKSLSDSVYGTLSGDADCKVGTVLASGATCDFSITKWVEGDYTGPDHVNVFTGKAVDNDETEAVDTDDATVDFSNVLPTIEVTKTPSVSVVPETGGNVTFTFTVKNTSSEESVTIKSLSDSVYGTLSGDADCKVGTVLASGATCDFSITKWVEGDYTGSDHVNVFTGKAVDNDGTEAVDTDDATVDFSNVLPTIEVTKTANPTAIPETGGNVTFTFTVKNTSSEESVTIKSLSDSVYGTLSGDADCKVGTVLASGATCDFSITKWVEGDYTGPDHVNVFTGKAVDNDGTEAVDTDDATVDFSNVLPTIEVTKTANPTAIPETGGNVTFTFTVKNTSSEESVTIKSLSDSVYGTLSGDADCKVGTVLASGATCDFSITKWVEGDYTGPDHVNVFTGKAVDNDETEAVDTDDATVDFSNVLPTIEVTKTANPTAIPETGGNVTFTFTVKNTSSEESVTIKSLSDSVYGTLSGDADCKVGTVLASGATCDFSITKWVEGDYTGPDHVNVFTGKAVDNDETEAVDTDDATVDFSNVLPTIEVTKTPSVSVVPETGGNVTFTFTVKNTSSEESVTIKSLSDSVYGTLSGDADCKVGTVLASGATCDFSITKWVEGDYTGSDHVNVFTGKAVDNDGTEAVDTDDATVDFSNVLPTIEVTKTANPTAIPETGGNVTFTFTVKNTSSEESVTIKSLSDSVYGTLSGDADCKVGTVLASGATCDFSITKWVEGDYTGSDHVNVFTGKAVDNDGTEAVDTDDATVDFSNVLPTIEVTKTANPTAIPETGGNVTFTFTVKNTSSEESVTIKSLSDSVYGTLSGDADCKVGTVLASGATCDFSITKWVEGDYTGPDHVNVFTGKAVDNDGTEAVDTDDATVDFSNVLPTIEVTKTANPTAIPETGGNVTFTFTVKNTSSEESVTIKSLSDSVYGTLSGDADCKVGTVLASGATCDFSITKWVEGDYTGSDHVNVFTGKAVDNDGTEAVDTDDATVDFSNVLPTIEVTKTANPTAIPETGGNVTFTFTVKNTSSEESVTIKSLSDSVYGTLSGDADCKVGTVLASGATCDFSITKWVEGDYTGPDHVNVFTGKAVDNDETEAVDTDDATVDFSNVLPTIEVTKTPSVSVVPETGGNVTFTFTVKNTSSEESVTIKSLSDSVYGTLSGDADCKVGTVLASGATCDFSITKWVEGDYTGSDHVNVFTGKAVDNDGTEAVDTDDATVDFSNVLPTIEVTKTANPTAIPETGGNVTFTFTVKNTSSEESVTIKSLSDSVYGTLSGDADCKVGTVLASGATCDFSITKWVEGDYTGPDHVNVFTGKAVDNDETEAVDTDDATVDFSNVLPTILVTKTAGTLVLSVPGGDVLFTVVVTNNSKESVTLTTLTDNIYGNLNGRDTCATGGTIPANGGIYTCTFTGAVNGNPGFYTDVVTATATDNDGSIDTDTDDATVELEGGKIIVEKLTTLPDQSQQAFEFDSSWGDNFFLINDQSIDSGWLAPGSYSIEELTTSGWELTNTSCISSINDNETAESLELDAGETITCTFTNTRDTGSLTVYKVIDEDGDLTTTGDQIMGINWEFDVDGVSNDTSNPSSSKTDFLNGKIVFSELKTGTYDVKENVELGYEIVGANCGINNGSLDGYTMYSVDVSKDSNTICTFYNTPNGVVHGYKWNDIDMDGLTDEEPLLSGWTINLYKGNEEGFDETPLKSMDTDDTETHFGWYWFDHLFPGTYKVCEVQKEGWNQSYPINEDDNCHIIQLPEKPSDRDQSTNFVVGLEYNFGNYAIPSQLKITKDNDSPIDGLLTGSTVLYTIIVTAPSNEEKGTYLINNVKVTDILPKGFEYMSGTWTANSSVRGNIKGSITTEPEYNEGLATWNLGDMKEGEIVTLTYTAKINLLNEPGLYKDIAFVQGDSLLAEEDTGDVLGLSYALTEDVNTEKLGDNFVGTKVLVIEPIEDGGEVLGASTTLILPKTGAETYITLGALISMILGIFLLFFKKRKTSILVITFVFAIGIFTLLKPVQTYAQTTAKVSVRLEQPKTGITDREFNITYVALSIPVKPITVQCQYSLDGVNFSNFDISKTTNSGDCKVDQSIVTGSGTYYFKAIASTTDGEGAESEVVTVKVADKPSPVTEYSKAKAVCTYTLKFKSSTSKVQIFRSDNQKSFYADDTTLITKPYLTVTPNVLSTYTDTPADCSKEYYYAVRAVDEYSNVSALVTDNVVTVVEQTQTSTSQESEEVAGEETTTQQEQETTSTGEVAGEETTAQQEEKAETDTKDETKTEEKETEESIWDKYKYLIISVIVVALGSGIYDYIRRKK